MDQQRLGGGMGGRDPDSFYVEDCRQVQANTHKIQTLTGQISRLVGQMTSDRDFQHCRAMVDDAVRQASETKVLLQRIQQHQLSAQNASERNNRKMMYQKLSDNLAVTARVLEDVMRRYTDAERKNIAASSAPEPGAGSGSVRAPAPGADPLGVAARGSSSGSATVHRMDSDDEGGGLAAAEISHPLIGGSSASSSAAPQEAFDEDLRREKTAALVRVDEDMRCLQRIYTDLATAAEEQQSDFDTLESCMARASIDVERGVEQIEYGAHSWDRRMKRRLWTYGTITFVVLAMIWFWS